MAQNQKVDEQISYNWLFFLLAGAFGAVTFWAVYDETVTRREYKGYQEAFFGVETALAEKQWKDAQAKLEGSPEWKKLIAELEAREKELAAQSEAFDKAKADLQKVEYESFDKVQTATFTKSILDEKYYYFTVAKHEVNPGTPKEGPAMKDYDHAKGEYDGYIAKLKVDQAEADRATKIRDCMKKGHRAADDGCDVLSVEDYAKGGFQLPAGRKLCVDAYDSRIIDLKKQKEDMARATDELHRKFLAAKEKSSPAGIAGFFGPATEIVQENLEDLGRVDRCESCHMGASRGGFEKVAEPYFRSHPMRRTLLALHPPDTFGCTTCHDGQGRATQRFHAHAYTETAPKDIQKQYGDNPHHYAEKHFWDTPLLTGPFMESECRQCHRQEVELRANLKCESDDECPVGEDGKALKCAELIAPIDPVTNLNASLESKVDGGKYCGEPDAGDDTKVSASLIDMAPHLARGRKIIDEVACFGCHPIEGYDRPKAGPDLRHAKDKLNPAWMVEWILNPKAFRPTTRMPNFFPEVLHPEQYPPTATPKYIDAVAAIAKVVETDPEKRVSALEALGPEHFQPQQQAALLASFILSNSAAFEKLPAPGSLPAGDVKHGEHLVETLGCYGCHNVTAPGEATIEHKNRASHYDHGPELGNIGAKVSREWIYAWVKDPKAYAPGTRMPNLRLTDQEAADISAFLSGNKYVDGKPREYTAGQPVDARYTPISAQQMAVRPEDMDYQVLGKKLVQNYGCYGCHSMKGFETTPGIGAELSEFGTKEVSRLDYGDYIVDHSAQTWEAWIDNKLQHPRVYRYERVDTRMPQFDLKPDEIRDVMVVLKGMRGKTKDSEMRGHRLSETELIRERGRDAVRWFNCYGCHTVDGKTGDIRQRYQADDGPKSPRFAPPVINGEGGKTQPPWLFSFLKQPIKLRPHLEVRMPTFGFSDDQATTLVGMFSAFDGADYPYRDYRGFALEGPRKEQAQTSFKAAQCTQCHTLGNEPSADLALKGAPNLLLAKNRLRPEWIARWIRDPQVLYPGVNMPGFFNNGNPLAGADKNPSMSSMPGIAEVAKLDAAGVVYLLRDLLMTLEPQGGAAAAPAAQKQPVKKAAVPSTTKHAALGVKHASR